MFTAIKLLLGKFNLNYLIIGLVIYCSVITLLWQLEKTRHRLTISEYATLSAKRQAENEVEIRQREKITENVVNSYADSIEKVKKYYAENPTIKLRTIRLRNNSCDGMPPERESTSRVDTNTNGIDEAIAPELATEVQIDFEKASKEIVQCLELIKFSKEQDGLK